MTEDQFYFFIIFISTIAFIMIRFIAYEEWKDSGRKIQWRQCKFIFHHKPYNFGSNIHKCSRCHRKTRFGFSDSNHRRWSYTNDMPTVTERENARLRIDS